MPTLQQTPLPLRVISEWLLPVGQLGINAVLGGSSVYACLTLCLLADVAFPSLPLCSFWTRAFQ